MKLLKFPELRQSFDWDCGASVIQSVLVYYGIDIPEEALIKLAGTTKCGTPITKIKATFKKYGLNFKAGKMTVDDIKKYLDKKIPVILLVQAWSGKKKINYVQDWADGHYAVAIGYDSKKIYFEDPWTVKRTFLTFEDLEKRWHDIDAEGKKHINWGLAVWGKKAKYDLDKPKRME